MMPLWLWSVGSGMLFAHACLMFGVGHWLRGYIELALAILVQLVRAVDALVSKRKQT